MQECKAQAFQAGSKQRFDHHEVPTCAVCMEKLGSYGGPSSLGCGHNGCLECLQQIQSHNTTPLCPLCRTPFDPDLHLAPNLDLKDALEKLDSVILSSGLWDKEQTHLDTEMNESIDDDKRVNVSPWAPVWVRPQDIITRASNTLDPSHQGDMIQGDQNVHANTGNACAEVNFWTVAKGMLAILTRRTQQSTEHDNLGASNHNTIGPESTSRDQFGDLWSSVHLPSAPPLLTGAGDDARALRAILEAEPPQWVPDSACKGCMQCDLKFQPLARGRHHCRFCGGIFCRSCSTGRCLLPISFMQRDPQRVCDGCYERLEPVQHFLTNFVSNAAQIAVHDVTDPTCMRGWLNNPIGMCMQEEIYKATNTLRSFCKAGRLKPELSIPEAILRGAKGLAILTVAKVGMVLTYKLGTGLIVAQRDDGSWSPPTAVISCGLGWGLQAGGELTDFIIILPSMKSVKAFSGRVHASVGAGFSASVGPLGRLAEADLCVGDGGVATCYTYSCSQGAFVGVSFEGNVVAARADTNARFYGDSYLTPENILFGSVPLPRAAAPLYSALKDLYSSVGL